MIGAVDITLPMPPSVNEMFKTVRIKGRERRAVSQVYRDWKAEAGRALRSAAPAKMTGRVIMILSVERMSNRADLDNRIKAVQDLLAAKDHKIIEDDSQITALFVSWAPNLTGKARVLLMPVQPLTINFHPADDGASGGWFSLDAPYQPE